MNGIDTITEEAALLLLKNYYQIMTSGDSTDISNWFRYDRDGEKPLALGFQIGFPDFLLLCSGPGLTRLEVWFGLDTDTDPEGKLVLLLKISNSSSTLRSRYHKLTDPLFEYPLYDTGSTSIQYNKVPRIYHELWTRNWSYGHIPSNSLRIITNNGAAHEYETIKAYSFQLNDVLDILYPISVDSGGITKKDPKMHVYFACHSYQLHSSDAAWEEFDTTGIMFGMTQMNEDGNRTLISSCYDFSAPCPPTCPIV